MIQIELIETLPNMRWSEQALFEHEIHGLAWLEKTTRMYRLGDSGVLGLNYGTLTAPPWLWFMLADRAIFSDLKGLKRQSILIPPGTRTCVQAGYETGERFAAFFGFVPTGDSFTLNKVTYNIYRRD